MVASPEVCRMNGAKSRGAITARGKAIASRNATKHGLLSKQAPLLVTEDLESFEGLVQGLIDHYQPENPIEHFLIQQVAMGMLKQYRLWNVEAAIANIEILKAQRSTKFPDYVVPAKTDLDDLSEFLETRVPRETLLKKEESLLQALANDLECDLSQVQRVGEFQTLEAVKKSLGKSCYQEDPEAAVWHWHEELNSWLTQSCLAGKTRHIANFQEAIAHTYRLLELAQQRIGEINQDLEVLAATEQSIRQAEGASKEVQQEELISRYQRSINRALYEALDRLEDSQQRKNGISMGSFGQNSNSTPH